MPWNLFFLIVSLCRRFVSLLFFHWSKESIKRTEKSFSLRWKSIKQIKIQLRENIWYWLNFYFFQFSSFIFSLLNAVKFSVYSRKWWNRRIQFFVMKLLSKHLSQLSLFSYSIILLFIRKLSTLLIQPEGFLHRKFDFEKWFYFTQVPRSLLCIFMTLLEVKNCMNHLRLETFNAGKIGFENVQIENILTFKSTCEREGSCFQP